MMPIIMIMIYLRLLELTVSPALPLHWLMFVRGSANNISTTLDGVEIILLLVANLVLPPGDGLHEASDTLPVRAVWVNALGQALPHDQIVALQTR